MTNDYRIMVRVLRDSRLYLYFIDFADAYVESRSQNCYCGTLRSSWFENRLGLNRIKLKSLDVHGFECGAIMLGVVPKHLLYMVDE